MQRQYYLLSYRFLLFTGKKRKVKREVFSDSYTEATASAIKALLGMLARLPWGRRDVLSSINGKYGGVIVKYASPIVSYHWIKVFITS